MLRVVDNIITGAFPSCAFMSDNDIIGFSYENSRQAKE